MIISTVELRGVLRLQNQSIQPLTIGGQSFTFHRFSLGKPNEADRLRSTPRNLVLDPRLLTIGGQSLGEAIRSDGGGIGRLLLFRTYDVPDLESLAIALPVALYREQVIKVVSRAATLTITTGTDSSPLRNWIGTI